MKADFEITQGDDAPPWISTLGDSSGDLLDLTGATVTFHLWDRISGANVPLTGVATVVAGSPATQVRYDVAISDFASLTPGDYSAKWRVRFPSGAIESFPADHSTVRVYAAPPS